MLGHDMVPDSSTTPACPTPPTRRRAKRGVRKALRWGLVGGAFCVLSWCGLAVMSAGTAQAATGEDHGGTAVVTEHGPVEGLVNDVGTTASRLVDSTRVPDDVPDRAVADAGDVAKDVATVTSKSRSASEVSPSKADRGKTTDLGTTVDRLTTAATTSLERIGVPAHDVVGGLDVSVSTITTDAGAGAQLPVQKAKADSMLDGPAEDAVGQADSVSHGSAGGRAAVQQDGNAAQASTEHTRVGDPVGVADGDEDRDPPVQPSDPGTHTGSTTTSSSGSSSHDGGACMRGMSCQPSHSGSSVTAPSFCGVEITRNSAGKPRISPD